MPRLLIANDYPEQSFGQTADFSKGLALWSLRILWHIKDEDILVVPLAPDRGHLEYIADLIGVNYDSLQVIVAPMGEAHNLSPDRITHTALQHAVSEALGNRQLNAVLPLTPDASVVTLARTLGLEHTVPGAPFASQGGGMIANSKSIFRAIAAGTGAPIPEGFVTQSLAEAGAIITDMLLLQNVPVIVKKDFAQGCRGNEVLSPVEGTLPNGGRRGLVLKNQADIKNYLTENWNWLTTDGHHSVIIERYFPGSIAIFAEYNLADNGVTFAGIGEMLARPIADGQVVPPLELSPTTIAEIVDQGHRLSSAVHAIGYRGNLSADAIVTPDGRVMFSEYNGRITGSTHIYSVVGEMIVGKEWMQKRILLERRGWSARSFQDAVNMLHKSGLAYNSVTKTGVVLTGTFIPARQVISYTIVAEDMPAALKLEEQLHKVSPRVVEILT